MRVLRPCSNERGFTLVEVMMTMTILLVGLAGAVTLVNGANAITVETQQREAATNLQRELIEAARGVPYEQLTPNGLGTAIQSNPGLADSSPGGGWTIVRRHTTYTITTQVCSVDDTRDGLGSHVAGNYCAGQSSGSADDAPDDFKRVVITVTWPPGGERASSRQSTIVTNPSNNLGPAVLDLVADPDDEVISDEGVTAIDFTSTTPATATAVRFLVDGVVTGTDEPDASHHGQFEWKIDEGGIYVVDGTYVVTATALSHSGMTGPSRSVTIRLNRVPPVAPTGLTGGWNATRGGVELEWIRNEEADIVGYRAYRRAGAGPWTIACETGPSTTRCFDDLTAPFATSYEYYVVALDEVAHTVEREGAPSAAFFSAPVSTAPNPPATLNASIVGGAYQLDWTDPAPPAIPYAGDGTLYFRIYRSGTAVGDRLDHTGLGSDRSFTDVSHDFTGTREYWVSTVDENYSESALVGPVTLP